MKEENFYINSAETSRDKASPEKNIFYIKNILKYATESTAPGTQINRAATIKNNNKNIFIICLKYTQQGPWRLRCL